MTTTPAVSLQRALFPTEARHAALLRLLLAQDGSATRLCEALTGQAVGVHLQFQRRSTDVPAVVHAELGGAAWLERATTLHVAGQVLMDNLSYTRLDAVPADFLAALDAGQAPIGHLLDPLCIRRNDLPFSAELAARLWDRVGLPDPRAAKLYRIAQPSGPLMLVFETFRAAWAQWGEAA